MQGCCCLHDMLLQCQTQIPWVQDLVGEPEVALQGSWESPAWSEAVEEEYLKGRAGSHIHPEILQVLLQVW